MQREHVSHARVHGIGEWLLGFDSLRRSEMRDIMSYIKVDNRYVASTGQFTLFLMRLHYTTRPCRRTRGVDTSHESRFQYFGLWVYQMMQSVKKAVHAFRSVTENSKLRAISILLKIVFNTVGFFISILCSQHLKFMFPLDRPLNLP